MVSNLMKELLEYTKNRRTNNNLEISLPSSVNKNHEIEKNLSGLESENNASCSDDEEINISSEEEDVPNILKTKVFDSPQPLTKDNRYSTVIKRRINKNKTR